MALAWVLKSGFSIHDCIHSFLWKLHTSVNWGKHLRQVLLLSSGMLCLLEGLQEQSKGEISNINFHVCNLTITNMPAIVIAQQHPVCCQCLADWTILYLHLHMEQNLVLISHFFEDVLNLLLQKLKVLASYRSGNDFSTSQTWCTGQHHFQNATMFPFQAAFIATYTYNWPGG